MTDTIEPPLLTAEQEEELVKKLADMLTFKAASEHLTPAHVMRKLFGPSQADEYEALFVICRKAKTKQTLVAMSDDVFASHLCVYSQIIDSMAKNGLGLSIELTPKPLKGA